MEVRKACSGCRKEITSSSKRCSVCKHVFCGQECFRASWPTHRLECSENGIVRYAERLLKTSTIPCIMVSVLGRSGTHVVRYEVHGDVVSDPPETDSYTVLRMVRKEASDEVAVVVRGEEVLRVKDANPVHKPTPDYLAPILEKDVYERFLAGMVILILRGKELTWDYP
jgi:hypothetical protein